MKKIVFVSSFIVCFVSFVVVSCKKTSTSSASSYTSTCSSVKSYSIDVRPIIQGNCVSCHSSYSSYSGVSSSASSIKNSIVNGTMPKGNTLTSAQKDNIVCWIDAGAANN
jgi:uncharacterized membrane protein